MEVIREIAPLRGRIKEIKGENMSIGFVPTMGFLHEGHLSLMRKAREENDYLVISIFVNPLQFGVGEDYDEYPRDLERDKELAASVGCDLIFSPPVKEMYPRGYSTFVEVERLTERLCGASRPGHFRGVTTVVTKLFNLISPDRAYFGQKDAQQAIIIQKMIQDLNMDLELVILPTVREEDGLAMSSRNKYLTPYQREQALLIYKALQKAQENIEVGEKNTERIRELIREIILQGEEAVIDYIEIVDTYEFQPLSILQGSCLIAVAVKLGEVRLIDNIMVEV